MPLTRQPVFFFRGNTPSHVYLHVKSPDVLKIVCAKAGLPISLPCLSNGILLEAWRPPLLCCRFHNRYERQYICDLLSCVCTMYVRTQQQHLGWL